MKGKLYIVSTPIGNYKDITLRALEILKETEILACEEFKMGRRLLAKYGIKKELFTLNEHTEKEATDEIVKFLLEGKDVAIFSDAGTPLFSDPGQKLVNRCVKAGIQVVPVPGASSIMAALVGSGFLFDEFYYRGWLSPKREIRIKQIHELKNKRELIIILETPYRLKTLIEDIVKHWGKNLNIVIAFKLTQSDERFIRGKAEKVLHIVKNENLKGEFVLLIDNRRNSR